MGRLARRFRRKRTKRPDRANLALGDQCDPELWKIAEEVLSFSSMALVRLAKLPTRSDLQARAMILGGLHRRAVITATAVANLIRVGLIEPSLGLSRTLLDLELATRLVTRDPSDKTARRLVGFDYWQRGKRGVKQLSNAAMRDMMDSFTGEKTRVAALTKAWKQNLDGPFFDSVRDELLEDLGNNKNWHGLGNTESAFAAAGMSTDYFQIYGLGSFFSHGINVEYDFQDIRDGVPFLKPIFAVDPDIVPSTLGLALYRLYVVVLMIVADLAEASSLPERDANEARISELRLMKRELIELAERLTAFPNTLQDTDKSSTTGGDGTS